MSTQSSSNLDSNGFRDFTSVAGASCLVIPRAISACQHIIVDRLAAQEFTEIDVSLESGKSTLWCMMQPGGRPSFTPELLSELRRMQHVIESEPSAGTETPFDFLVLGSSSPGVFNLGGDLSLFHEKVMAHDWSGLRSYAQRCVELVYANHSGYGRSVISLGLIEGDALGGGFEAALSCDFLIAERQANLGFPEILFNLFPGMGAYTFLSRRIGPRATEEMLRSGTIYTAEQLRGMGVIDLVVEQGQGRDAVRSMIAGMSNRLNTQRALCQVKRRVNPITLKELNDIADIWVEAATRLTPQDLRNMRRIIAAQERARRRLWPVAS